LSFETAPSHAWLLRPVELQNDIDSLVGSVREGKANIRPSGNESNVLVYAEAKTVEERDRLVDGIWEAFDTKYSHL